MRFPNRSWVLGTLLVPFALTAAAAAADPNQQTDKDARVDRALDYAFRFASSIHKDPKDMGQAQEEVLLDFVATGSVEEAARRAEQVVGWHRGVVYAELAADRAKAGRREEARAFLAKAEAVRVQTEGWQGPRIASHIARAMALLGDLEGSKRLAAGLADADPQYVGLAELAASTGQAANGSFDAAIAALGDPAAPGAPDAALARAEGYLHLARRTGWSREQTRAALDAASRSLEPVATWTKAGLLQEIGRSYAALGDAEKAADALRSAESVVVPLPPTAALKGPMLASVARAWAEQGYGERAKKLLAVAEEESSRTLPIDQPTVLASIAAARFAIGDEADAMRVYDRAFAAASSLANSRPRALAVVEICRSIALTRVPLGQDLSRRLDLLLEGLGDPW